MAYWASKIPDFDSTNAVIIDNPGIKAPAIARKIGVCPSTIHRRLPSMEEAGYLYFEDEHGGLYSFNQEIKGETWTN